MSKTCLFIINGLGLGNSTRCFAVMEYLRERGLTIHVLTSGNGLEWFRDKKEVASLIPTESFFYAVRGGYVSGWQTVRAFKPLLARVRAKQAQLEQFLSAVHIDVAIVDSEYAVGPLLARGIPIVGLNNSEVVVSEYLRARHNPASIRSHFWCIEYADYLFHRRVCDLVVSPAALRTPVRHPRFTRVGLVVRRTLLDAIRRRGHTTCVKPRDIKRIVFMLSGSIHASTIAFDRFQLPFQVDIVGRMNESRGNVVFHGRLMDNVDLLMRADALVINGGYSALSEAVALGKPAFVIPVPGHAEQLINARLAQHLGCGWIASESDVLDRLDACYEANEWSGWRPRLDGLQLDGAAEAAEAIESVIAQRP